MRHAIIADIHSNLEALKAVLDDIERRGGVDEVWCLGDVVGYGPDPEACLALLRGTTDVCVAGNHDWAAAGKIDTSEFNPEAGAASQWTAEQLSDEERSFLSSLPLIIEKGDFTLAHGSPREPIWEYLTSPGAVQENLAHFQTRHCLVGHTHQPLVFACDETGKCSGRHFLPNDPLEIGEERLIINPGGVGQPRDGDPRASYAIHDSDEGRIRLYRVMYDIRATQKKMQAHGIPMRLSERLAYGL